METVYSELKIGMSYNCAIWCSATTYQKVNSSIVSKDAMNRFKEIFPLVIMFPLPVMHTLLNIFNSRHRSFGAKMLNYWVAIDKRIGN